MKKTYILYYDFKNTSGNHAGMSYLVNRLEEDIEQIVLLKHVAQEFKGGRLLAYIYSWILTLRLLVLLKDGDKVLFIEYLTKNFAFQDHIAKRLRFFGKRNKFLAMIHLSKKHLLELYGSDKDLELRIRVIDVILVLGSSLETFIKQINFHGKVVRTFHYVDNEFYTPGDRTLITNGKIQVLFLGSLKRNFSILKKVIDTSSCDINFHICLGRSAINLNLLSYPNVKSYGYLEEFELLKLMQKCNVNLSVLDDTVGSNVITTSLACSLVQVVSDVGSIRDYCSNDNSIFCNDELDYVDALHFLDRERARLQEMQQAALLGANDFSYQNFRDFVLKDIVNSEDKCSTLVGE